MERDTRKPNNVAADTKRNSEIPNVSVKKDGLSLWPDIEEMRKTGRVPRSIQFFKADAF